MGGTNVSKNSFYAYEGTEAKRKQHDGKQIWWIKFTNSMGIFLSKCSPWCCFPLDIFFLLMLFSPWCFFLPLDVFFTPWFEVAQRKILYKISRKYISDPLEYPLAYQESNRFETAFAALLLLMLFQLNVIFLYATNIPCTLKIPPSISMFNVTEHYKYNIVQDLRKNVLWKQFCFSFHTLI